MKSRRMTWAVLLERMGDRRGAYKVFVGRPEGLFPSGLPTKTLEDLGVCGDNIKIDFQESGGKTWTGLIWLRIKPVGERL